MVTLAAGYISTTAFREPAQVASPETGVSALLGLMGMSSYASIFCSGQSLCLPFQASNHELLMDAWVRIEMWSPVYAALRCSHGL